MVSKPDRLYQELNADKALIWRLVHRDNVPWILEHGLPCASSGLASPAYVSIGRDDLIERRRLSAVPIAPGGTLADYVPFYFTPFSLMLYNVHTGRNVSRCSNDELVILVSDLHHIRSLGLSCLFTDSHANATLTRFHDDPAYLDRIDWDILQRRDFRGDVEDPRKQVRYQAEALVHRHVPIEGIRGIVCHDESVEILLKRATKRLGLSLSVHVRKGLYFQ